MAGPSTPSSASTAADRRRDQRAGLQLVQAPQGIECSRTARSRSAVAPATSRNWPPTIPCVPAAVTTSRIAGDHVGRLALLLVEREAERLGEQAVAGQDRHVLAERDVAGRLAAAKPVVVHRREVVVDQRVGVDHLDRRGEREHLVRRAADRLGRGEREHRPDALAAGEQRIAHRLLEAGRAGLGGEAKPLEVGVDLLLELYGVGHRLDGDLRAGGAREHPFSPQRRRSWPSDSAAPRARASISAPRRAAISAQRSTRSAASSASTASARSLSATASSSSASAVE